MLLSTQRFTASKQGCVNECVLIHGWGLSSVIWTHWLAQLTSFSNVTVIDLPGYGFSTSGGYSDTDQLISDIVARLPQQAVYIGYSLGGMLALTIAKKFAPRVQAVITLASNLSFVASEHWPAAMPQSVYDQFYSGVNTKPQQTLKRFMALQVSGASQEKALLKNLKAIVDTTIPSQQTLVQSLDCLVGIDNSNVLAELSVPILHLFGECDQLVPSQVGKILCDQYQQKVKLIAHAPHAVFLSDPITCSDAILEFLCQQKIITDSAIQRLDKRLPDKQHCDQKYYDQKHGDQKFVDKKHLDKKHLDKKHLDKKHVARSFSRAASTYDSVAELQRSVGKKLLSYLIRRKAQVVLDLGCGTGFFSSALKASYPECQLISMDLAEGMVGFAKKQHADVNASWLCGDAENIPLANDSVDVIYASLSIQWCENTELLFAEIYRVLKPKGIFVVSTLGPDTLHEIKTAWKTVDDYVHVNQFIEKAQLIESVQRSGLINANGGNEKAQQIYFDEQIITLEYGTLKNLTRELKSLGAHNVNNGRPSGLMGKHKIKTFMQAYETFRNNQGFLPASYQVWYGVLAKPSQ